MPLIEDYFNLQRKYEAQYGERTVVLMQVGTFYEMWQYSPEYCTSDKAKLNEAKEIQEDDIGHAIELSVTLNCILTFENSNEPYTFKNPHKVGFPLVAYDKNADCILNNDYVIIRVDQVKGTKDPVERYVAEVRSPTMQLDNITLTRTTSNIACIYIEYHQGINKFNKYENFVITTGAAVVDVITGHNIVCEYYSKVEDQICAVQELYRFLIAHYPRELIVHIGDMPAGLDHHTDDNPNPYVKYLERVLELRRFDRMNAYINMVSAEYKKPAYQTECLNKIFSKQSAPHVQGMNLNIIQRRNEKIIEELGLERMNYGRVAYMLLMQHCHSHNPDIISKLSKPDLQWIDEKKHLILTYNAIVQLDLIPIKTATYRTRRKVEIDSLLSVLDHNQTHLGRRALRGLLQNPMLDPNEINLYYDMVGEMFTLTNEKDPLWLVLDRQLKELPDIGCLQRKLEIKLISPKELAILHGAYIKIINIYVTVLGVKTPVLHSQMMTSEDVSNFNEFVARFMTIINFEALECCNINTSVESNDKWLEFVDCPIKPRCYPDLDEQTQALIIAETSLQRIVDHMNGFLTHTRGKKIEFKSAKKKKMGAKKQDPGGTILTTTSSKANALSTSPIDVNLCGIIQILPYSASDRIITSDKISDLCSSIDKIRTWMRRRLLGIYESILDELASKYTFYVSIAALIAKLDLIHSYAKITFQYNYHRPELIVSDNEPSYLEAREIRHPIIERIIDGSYVTNDIFLGNGNIESQADGLRSSGMLLFGVNTCGKTSMAKAIALNIIMAQIGCYVPSRLRYKPYSKIITRLTGNDNIFKGDSSFAVEMSELRTIIRQADETTLVVGDELCSGTETHSGMAITVSTLLSLIKKRSTFIFATHMHELLNLSYIGNLHRRSLSICHLAITYDDQSENLIYNRKLKLGSGPSNYGLMVAKSLGLPNDFMDVTSEILLEIMGENKQLVDTKTSRYNKKLYVDSCAKCNRNKNQVELHSHHLIEQKHSDEKGIISGLIKGDDGVVVDVGVVHQNAKDNLIVLCRDCHKSLHQKKQELETITVGNGKIIRLRPNTPSQDTSPQDTPSQDTSPQDTPSQDTSPQDTPSQQGVENEKSRKAETEKILQHYASNKL